MSLVLYKQMGNGLIMLVLADSQGKSSFPSKKVTLLQKQV